MTPLPFRELIRSCVGKSGRNFWISSWRESFPCAPASVPLELEGKWESEIESSAIKNYLDFVPFRKMYLCEVSNASL